jgi:ribonuclease P protein component
MSEKTPHSAINNSFRFFKSERLSHKKNIETLFQTGNWLSFEEFSLVYKLIPEKEISILISVPKKYQAHAVDRNHSKRVIREVYRKNKEILYPSLEKYAGGLQFAIICKTKKPLEYNTAELKIILTLQQLSVAISKMNCV